MPEHATQRSAPQGMSGISLKLDFTVGLNAVIAKMALTV